MTRNLSHNTNTSTREDGRETRAAIIEWAGRILARKGYAKTTSKEICQAAGVNQAAVNYHFGNRDGLYIAVLEEVHNYLLNIDMLTTLNHSALLPRQKLEIILDTFIELGFQKNDWHVRVWINELLQPSPFIGQIISRKGWPKFYILRDILCAVLGHDKDNIQTYSAYMSLIAPFFLLFISQNSPVIEYLPVSCPRDEFIEQLKENALLLLDTLAKK